MNDLERWRCDRWDQITGNQQLKNYWLDLIWNVRVNRHRSGFNAMIKGDSRSGKTLTTQFGMKCLGCLNLNLETFDPCGSCSNCTLNHHLYGNEGWENVVDFLGAEEARTPVRYSYRPIDCTRITERELEEVLLSLRADDHVVRVIYLDEVHRLSRRFMDERLLKPLEDFPAIWIASSANIGVDPGTNAGLEKMFQNRFTYRLSTEKPTSDEMVIWLAERCAEFGIQIDDPLSTLMQLARRSHQNPGMAIQVLNKAHKSRTRLLSRTLVDKHVFDFDE